MKRKESRHNGLSFSYLDWGGENRRVIVALQAHLMEAATFAPLALAFARDWRLLALDQRGHGYSDHAAGYTRDHDLADLEAFFHHLNLNEATVLDIYSAASRHISSPRPIPKTYVALSSRHWRGSM
ncbi:MAG: hypothetical protein WB762_12070 [Candidatus Sulfotelmatobacter sp.]